MAVYSVSFQLDGIDVIDARDILRALRQSGQRTDHVEGWANSVRISAGPVAGKAYLLLSKSDLDDIYESYSVTSLDGVGYVCTANIHDTETNATIQVFGLCPVKITSVLTSNDPTNDNDNVYLVEFADARHAAARSAVNYAYNMLLHDRTGGVYMHTSQDGAGTPWTWEEMLTDLWNLLPDCMGAIDLTLATLPSDAPKNYDFQGWNAWDAITSALAEIDHWVVSSLDGTFAIEPRSASIPDPSTTTTTWGHRLIDRSHAKQGQVIPETVTVFFPRKDDYFPTDGLSDEQTSKEYRLSRMFHVVQVETSDILASVETVPGSQQVLHATMDALFDSTGAITNESACEAHAALKAARWLNYVYKDPLHEIYNGVLDISPSGTLSGVIWHDLGTGLVTELVYSHHGYVVPAPMHGKFEDYDYAGPADISRQHIDPDYWCVARLDSELYPHGSASARVCSIQKDGYGNVSVIPHNSKPTTIYEVRNKGLLSGDTVIAHYHQQLREWITAGDLSYNMAYDALAKLASNMCPDDASGSLTDVEILSEYPYTIPGGIPTSALNLFHLSGLQGYWVFLKYWPRMQSWFIVQVQHRSFDVPVENELTQADKFLMFSSQGQVGDCAIKGHVLDKVSLMSCMQPDWKEEIPLYHRGFVTEVSKQDVQGDCPKLVYKASTACLFEESDGQGDTETTIMEFEAQLIVTGFYDTGTCLRAVYQGVCVAGVSTAQAEQNIICGVDCEGSSGSSGQ
jgi:hypothetical protein